MKRREFITLLSGAAAAWPLAARAQQGDRMRRIGVLMVVAETDPDAKRFVQALETRLDAASWHKGRNLEITYRWGPDAEQLTRHANELVLSAPDVLVVLGTDPLTDPSGLMLVGFCVSTAQFLMLPPSSLTSNFRKQ